MSTALSRFTVPTDGAGDWNFARGNHQDRPPLSRPGVDVVELLKRGLDAAVDRVHELGHQDGAGQRPGATPHRRRQRRIDLCFVISCALRSPSRCPSSSPALAAGGAMATAAWASAGWRRRHERRAAATALPPPLFPLAPPTISTATGAAVEPEGSSGTESGMPLSSTSSIMNYTGVSTVAQSSRPARDRATPPAMCRAHVLREDVEDRRVLAREIRRGRASAVVKAGAPFGDADGSARRRHAPGQRGKFSRLLALYPDKPRFHGTFVKVALRRADRSSAWSVEAESGRRSCSPAPDERRPRQRRPRRRLEARVSGIPVAARLAMLAVSRRRRRRVGEAGCACAGTSRSARTALERR